MVRQRGAAIREETPAGLAVDRRMVTRHHRLEFDKRRCTGCQICTAICPKQAIELQRGTVEGGRMVVRPDITIDPAKCTFCGECVALCPTHALELLVDGKPQVPVLEMEVFPQLDRDIQVQVATCQPTCGLACQVACKPKVVTVQARRSEDGQVRAIEDVAIDRNYCTYCTKCAVACPATAITVRKPWRGRLGVAAELCPPGCWACAQICPNGALSLREGRIEVDLRFCISCGACVNLCPVEGALTVERSGINHAPIRSGAWYEALEKLVSTTALSLELDTLAQARRRQVLSYLPGVPRTGQ